MSHVHTPLMKNPAAICLACLLGGGVIGWAAVSWQARRGVGEPATAPGPRPGGLTSTAPLPPWGKQDFLKALERTAAASRASGPTTGPLDALLAKWTDDELRAALDETLHDPETVLSPALALAVFREYFRRDLDRALAWFQDRTALHQQVFATHMAEDWPEERGVELLGLYQANRSAFRNADLEPLLQKGIFGISSRGPAAVAALIGTFREEDLAQKLLEGPLRFAPGFDFPALLGSSALAGRQPDSLKAAILTAWHAQVGEAAYQWMLDTQGAYAIATMPQVPYSNMEGSSTFWLTGKLESLPPADLAAFLDAMTPEWAASPYRIRAISENASPTLRREIFTRGLQGLYTGEANDSLQVLEAAVSDPAGRLNLLEALERLPLPAGSTLEARPLEQDEQEAFRNTLSTWGADETRADAILRRFTDAP